MKIFIISQFFYPETGAAANRVYELGKSFVKNGHDFSVLTTFPNYPKGELFAGYKKSTFFCENIDGMKVFRVPSFISKYSSSFSRARIYISFAINALRNINNTAKADIIIGTSGPVFVLIAAYYFSKTWHVPFVVEVRDLQFKALKATGWVGGLLIQKIVAFLELYFLKKADLIVPVTYSYEAEIKKFLTSHETRFAVIENGMDFSRLPVSEVSGKVRALSDTLRNRKSQGITVLSYFGVLGLSQKIEELCKAFVKKRRDGLLLLIVGNGTEEISIRDIAETDEDIMYHESISEDELSVLYSLSDFNIVKIIDHPDFAATIPSKLYRIIGSRSIPIFIGPEGEAATLVRSINEKLSFRDHEIEEMFSLITSMPMEVKSYLKQKCYNLAQSKYNRNIQAQRYVHALSECLEKRKTLNEY
jgi:glycosyltransferase involved in cell wall biosynthesis